MKRFVFGVVLSLFLVNVSFGVVNVVSYSEGFADEPQVVYGGYDKPIAKVKFVNTHSIRKEKFEELDYDKLQRGHYYSGEWIEDNKVRVEVDYSFNPTGIYRSEYYNYRRDNVERNAEKINYFHSNNHVFRSSSSYARNVFY